MYYSGMAIIAIFILFINNYDILFHARNDNLDDAHKAYKVFLIWIACYYITDILWGPLSKLKNTSLVFIDTIVYFIAMALSVLFWTKYVIIYLNKKNFLTAALKLTGMAFFLSQVVVLSVNCFKPIAFWYDAEGNYHVGIARNLNFGFQILLFLFVAAFMFNSIIKTKGDIRRRHKAICLFSIIMIIFVFLQKHYPLMPFYAIGCMLGTCLLHTFVLEDEKDARRKELESILQIEKIQEFELGNTRKIAYSDPLTGVKNRIAYFEDIGSIDQRIEDGFLSNFGIVVCDVNDLKIVNDTLGHKAGDEHIKNASIILSSIFEHSTVYRIGGDEFVIFLTGEDYVVHKKLLNDLDILMKNNVTQNGVVISFGYAEYSRGQDKNFLQLFNRADNTMYKYKKKIKKLKATAE